MTFKRTLPDHGITPSEYIPADVDNAELAARLGSIDTFRREGRVLSLADFSPAWSGWEGNNFLRCYTSPRAAVMGAASMYLTTQAVGDLATITKKVPISASLKMGISLYSRFDFYYLQYLYITIQRVTPLLHRFATIRINFSTSDIHYRNNTGAYTLLINYPDIRNLNNWSNFKLIADYETDKYLRFYINTFEVFSYVNLAPEVYQVAAADPGNTFIFQITATDTGGATPASQNIDGVIISAHEY
jgi:hypothetical protein